MDGLVFMLLESCGGQRAPQLAYVLIRPIKVQHLVAHNRGLPQNADAGDVAPEAVPPCGIVFGAAVPKAFGVVFPNGAGADGGRAAGNGVMDCRIGGLPGSAGVFGVVRSMVVRSSVFSSCSWPLWSD